MPTAHDSWAWVYDEVYEKSFGSFYTNLTSQTLSVVDGLLAPDSSILDVGVGTGRLAIPHPYVGIVSPRLMYLSLCWMCLGARTPHPVSTRFIQGFRI